MFCAIREYDGISDMKQAIKKVEGELLPAIRDMEGYQSYMLVNCGEGLLTSISLFDTEEQADAANEKVAELVGEHLTEFAPNEPTISVGEIVFENRR